MVKIGITEAGDGGLDLSWVDKLDKVAAAVIVTKHLTTANLRLLTALVENKSKLIVHCTCTGYGGTVIEPNVPNMYKVLSGAEALVKLGFPVEQIVLRTDPIIPTEKGIKTVHKVWDLFAEYTQIKRCRYSVLDMYPHVKERFLSEVGKVPFDTFRAPQAMMDSVRDAVRKFGHYQFESCAENLPEPVGCISRKDLQILGIPYNEAELDRGFQRKGCLCIAGKTELLSNKWRCPSKCVYCYWKDCKEINTGTAHIYD